MTVESQNPYQSPTPVDQPSEVVNAPALFSAVGRATGLGLLGAGTFATPILLVAIFAGDIDRDSIEGMLSISAGLGVVFAASEVLRIGLSEGQVETATRVVWSGGLLVVSYFGVLLFHSYVLPRWFLIGPQDFSLTTAFWFIAIQTIVIYLLLLCVGRQVAKWWQVARPQSLACETSPQELIDGN